MRIESHRNLIVWQKSIQLTLCVYKLSASFPRNEEFGLTSQLRRASVSIAANIAEGNGRFTDKDYARFLSIAIGSAREVDTLLFIASELGYGSVEAHESCASLLVEVSSMLRTILHRIVAATQGRSAQR